PQVDQTSFIECTRKFRIHADRTVEVLKGTSIVALRRVRDASGINSIDIFWIEADRFVVILNGVVKVALGGVRDAAGLQRIPKTGEFGGVLCDGGVEILNGAVIILLPQVDQASLMQCTRSFRSHGDCSVKVLYGPSEVSLGRVGDAPVINSI